MESTLQTGTGDPVKERRERAAEALRERGYGHLLAEPPKPKRQHDGAPCGTCGKPMSRQNRSGFHLSCRGAKVGACSKCGKPLGASNRSGIHVACAVTAAAEALPKPKLETPFTRPVGRPPVAEVERRFRAATKALGFDPDAMLEGFMTAWLTKVKNAAGGES
jgi:hypothetical protein